MKNTFVEKYVFEEKLYPTSIAMLPSEVIIRHNKIIEKYGLENLIKKREFKKAREMYQTARYAIGITAKTGIYSWVCPASEKNETPDTYLISFPTTGKKKMSIECVEIALWDEHVNDMFKIIEGKINKAYPFNFCIVIHVEQLGSQISSKYYEDIHNKLKKYSISAGAVRFWHAINNKGDKDTLLGELYPSNEYTEFSSQGVLQNYHSFSQKTIRIDIDSKPNRWALKEGDINMVLPELPERIA